MLAPPKMVLYKTIMRVHEKNVLYTITAIRQGLLRFLGDQLSGAGLDDLAPSWGDILYVLDRKGPLSMQDLARHTIKDKSTVSLVVSRLEELGYIVKEKDPADARKTILRLAPGAMRLRDVLYGISERMNERLFKGFTPKEKKDLFMLLEKLLGNI